MGTLNILATDIGGTNSRFGHFILNETGELVLRQKVWFMTQEAESFASFMDKLGSEGGFELSPSEADIISIAVAGPVVGGVYAAPPLIPFDVDISGGCAGSVPCLLMNDFIAQAYACLSPVANGATVVKEGEPEAGGTIAVMGAGTGLGKAALIPCGSGGYAAMSSEGGHMAFPFLGDDERKFEQFLLGRLGARYITPNDVVSGGGLCLLHEFLTGEALKPAEVASVLDGETLRWASRFYGRAARDFALETLCLGGIYIAGGVASRTPELLTSDAFMEEFLSSDKLEGILEQIPIWLQSDQDSGLWGAAMKAALKLKGKA